MFAKHAKGEEMKRISRRDFLGKTGKAAAGAGFGLTAARYLRAGVAAQGDAPNEKILLGLIGCGYRGTGILRGRSFEDGFFGQPQVGGVAAVCDVDDRNAERAAAMVEKQYGKRPRVFKDFRKLLELKEVDVVIVATPDHWHALPFISACEAGKDIFLEKPLSHNIVEARSMLAAAKKFKRVVQVGTWQRSVQHIVDAIDFVRAGKLGRISVCRAWKCGIAGVGREKPSLPPPNLDWDFWLGPAPYTEYRQNRCHYQWRWFFEYGTGETGDSGAHMMDLILLGMGVTSPLEVASYGGKLVCGEEDDRTTPDTQMVIYKFPDFVMNWEVHVGEPGLDGGSSLAAEFIGQKGWLIVDRNKYVVGGTEERPITVHKVGNHAGNFLDCIKSRENPRSEIESMYYTTVMCHLGNIAYRVGRSIQWDADNGLIVGDEEAMRCPQYQREYRKPWTLPIYKL
jgi:predicted dehydrogenase